MATTKRRAPPPDPIETQKSILQAIAEAETPIPFTALGSLPALGRKVPAAQVRELLAGDLAAGRIFEWPKAFWREDPAVLARSRILAVATAQVLSRSELAKQAAAGSPSLNPTLVKKVQSELLRDRRLREVPPAPQSKAKRLIDAEHPEVYLESAVASLLESFGINRPPHRIRILLAAESSDTPPEPEDSLIRDAAEKMFAAMNRIAFSPGNTVTFYRLRQQPELAEIPKKIFDPAALLLQHEHRALLSMHDHAASLSPEEREHFVTDGHGKYYVSLYAR